METIRLNIAGRVYPLTVPAAEAADLQAAASAVSRQVEQFREQYQVQDRGDLLAMTALQFASRPAPAETVETPAIPISEENSRRLDDLLTRVDAALTES